MKFWLDWGDVPRDKDLLKIIEVGAESLSLKLSNLDVETLPISDYNRRYFGGLIGEIQKSIQLRSHILAWTLFGAKVPLDESVFVDYGAGSGLLSLLAKEVGVGTVIYNDIFDVSCRDAKLIAEELGSEADHYVHGELDDVSRVLDQHGLSCNAIASYDVIEHIYDVDLFFEKLQFFSKEHITVFMCSGANKLNPYINYRLVKQQIEIENNDRVPKWGVKPTDCMRSYLAVRREMILNFCSKNNLNLSEGEIDKLSRNTRGMIQADIHKAMHHYVNTKEYPHEPEHPTNTCDPYNGNWAEHLMDPDYLVEILNNGGFQAAVMRGYYGRSKHPFKRCVGYVLNVLIRLFGKKGIHLSPFYSVYGIK